MSTNTALDDIKARAEGHTEGPWRTWQHGDGHRNAGVETTWAHEGDEPKQITDWCFLADAELIAAAPKMLAALKAVQALHRKVLVYVTEAGDCKHGADCESVEIAGESMCPDETDGYTCGYCAELNTEEYPDWPCSTITAIEDALS